VGTGAVVIVMEDEFLASLPLSIAVTERFSVPLAVAVNSTEAPEVVFRLPSAVLFNDQV
jgi:threonine/homoserine efflux transporter RhtA